MTSKERGGVWNDWVGDLFAPTIDLGVEDILQGVDKDNAVKSKIKRVSVLDPERVKEIYERVHMMTVLDKEMKEKQTEKAEGKASSTVTESKDHPVEKASKVEDLDLNDSCIWNTNEIKVIRKVMKTIKDQNMKLKVRNRELEKRNSELEGKNFGQEEELEKLKIKLKEVIKANSRLKIHCEHLQSEFDLTNARMTAMEQVFKEVSEEKASMAREVQEIRINSDKDRMDKTRLEVKLESLQREATSQQMAAIDSVKLQCQGEIMKLNEQIKDLTTELNKERKLHRTTKKGLDHLRNHFASLPMSHILPPNSVRQDEIDEFQY
ncbi:hypothetical protein FSP39_024085 [Pinctada imbricata]|uniref:Uncharacterized protein n=1 Tax=Pinctada imbricata TaxID=66713 RepID=A0AA88Y288_PINIB|nr:hypothetical protein FSP39_024085 [Pinctada imbricata]